MVPQEEAAMAAKEEIAHEVTEQEE